MAQELTVDRQVHKFFYAWKVCDAFPSRISHTNVVDICHNEQHRGVMNGKKHNRRCLHCRFALGFFQKENHVAVQILSPSFPFEFSKPFQILDILYLFLSSLMFFLWDFLGVQLRLLVVFWVILNHLINLGKKIFRFNERKETLDIKEAFNLQSWVWALWQGSSADNEGPATGSR